LKYCYDLSRAPASFDFVVFLAVCHTDAMGEFDLDIVKGPNKGFRNDDLPPKSTQEREQLLENVMLPATRLFPVGKLTVFPEVSDGLRPGYTSAELIGKNVKGLKVPAWALEAVRTMFPDPPIVITLRNAPYHPERNSKLGEWREVEKHLSGYKVVVLEDGWFPKIPMESNLIMRAAFYEHALLNLTIPTGPAALMYLNPMVNFLMFRPFSNTIASTVGYLKAIGLERGKSYPWSNENQKVVWKDDLARNIMGEVNLVLNKLAA
jgi:hypothetical protein